MGASPASTYSTMYVHARHLKLCLLDNFWMIIIRFGDTILHCPPPPQHFALSERNFPYMLNRWALNKIPILALYAYPVILLSLSSQQKKIAQDVK